MSIIVCGKRTDADRQVHARLEDGAEIVRYGRSGKWWYEAGLERYPQSLSTAVQFVADPAEWIEGVDGGSVFDRAVRKKFGIVAKMMTGRSATMASTDHTRAVAPRLTRRLTMPEPVFEWATNAYTQIDLLSDEAKNLNLLADIRWPIRTDIRDTQGHLDKATDALVELIGRLDTDDAEAWLIETFGSPD
jgi:hypothetical protein